MTAGISVKQAYLLSIFTGLCWWLSWPPIDQAWLAFFAFIPLLWALESQLATGFSGGKVRYWLIVYTGLLVWNVLTTWWVGKASVAGGLFANFANPALQSIPFMLFRSARRHLNRKAAWVMLVTSWMALEYLHLRWEFTWPWLTLGNVFAGAHTWVQWYELTGVFGGTLWVWTINILMLEWLLKLSGKRKGNAVVIPFFRMGWVQLAGIIMLVVIPVTASLIRYGQVQDEGSPVRVTVLQPNFDPYTEKFSLSESAMLDKMLSLSATGLTDSTDYLVWPETSVPQPIWLNRAAFSGPIRRIRSLTDQYPDLTTVIGINAFMEYDSKEELTPTARELVNRQMHDTVWYDAFNSSIQIDTSGRIPLYHKSKLVPGVERLPYPGTLKFMEYFTLDLGGISGSLGTQKDRSVFYNSDSTGVGTAICYESIFGEYVTRYVKNGAGLLFIITNDGWWGNTAGYKQHCAYASLRAIENRRSIARSANTGISCFVNQRGDISQATAWAEDAVITGVVYANSRQTFYTRNGDYLARTACWVMVLLWLFTFVRNRTARLRSISK